MLAVTSERRILGDLVIDSPSAVPCGVANNRTIFEYHRGLIDWPEAEVALTI